MEILITKNKIPWYCKILPFVGDLLGATIALIFLAIFYIPIKLFGKGNKEANKRKIVDIKNNELEWEFFTEQEGLKIYESTIWDWPKELDHIDNDDEMLVKRLKTEPEMAVLDHIYFSNFYPYDMENFFVEYHKGLYLIAYPNKNEQKDNYALYHLNYRSKKLNKIKDFFSCADEVNYPNYESLELISKTWDEKETLLIIQKNAT
jgi:hypothetical protein